MYVLIDPDEIPLVVGGYHTMADQEIDDDNGGIGLELVVQQRGLHIPDAHEAVAPDLAVVGLRDDVDRQLHVVYVDDARTQEPRLAEPAVYRVRRADVRQQARGPHPRAHQLRRQGGLFAGLLDDGLQRARPGRYTPRHGGVEHVRAAEEMLGASRDPEPRYHATVILGGARAHIGDHVRALQEDAEKRGGEALHRHGARGRVALAPARGPGQDGEGLAVLLGEQAEGVLGDQDVHELLEGGREGGGAVGPLRRIQNRHGARVLVRDLEGRRPRHLGHRLGPHVAVRLGVAGQDELIVDL